jgi:hypothetical protein
MKYQNIEFDGVDNSDYPDFCDAFICYAEDEEGEPLTEDELDLLNDDREFVHSTLWNQLF